MSDDPRVAPVEQNLFDCMPLFDISDVTLHLDDDVWTWTSDIDFPLFSGAVNARFSPESTAARTHETLDRLVGNGRPFMWWLTPSTRSPELEAVLVERGLVTDEPTTGMYVDLADVDLANADLADADPPDADPADADLHDVAADEGQPAGVSVEVTTEETLDAMVATMLDGFGMPATLHGPLRQFCAGGTDTLRCVNVLARADGEPAGAGSVVVVGDVAGLYNIAVPERARGRGIGAAVTRTLMRLGADLGATRSILHASPMGRSVYARLGYRPVCEITQYVWMPPGADD